MPINIQQNIRDFISFEINTPKYIEQDWKDCYDYFQQLFQQHRIEQTRITEQERRNASKYLGVYLNSYGMYKSFYGKDTILNKTNTRILEPVIDLIFAPNYVDLWNIDLSNTHLISDNVAQMYEIFELIRVLLFDQIHIQLGRGINIQSYDLIASKIILGTICCFPAYDDYVKATMKSENHHNHGTFELAPNVNSFIELSQYYNINVAHFNETNGEYDYYYPSAKLFDMCFWFEEHRKRKSNKLKQFLIFLNLLPNIENA
jgi:hypothetical protein